MHIWRKWLATKKAISWFLIAVVLAIVLLPTHMHLQHVDSLPTSSHEHAIDYHVIYDQHDHDHSEVAVLDATADYLLKQLDDNPLALFTLFSLILILASLCSLIRYPLNTTSSIKDYQYHITPPLRAPPL
jgi:hypothetical protein